MKTQLLKRPINGYKLARWVVSASTSALLVLGTVSAQAEVTPVLSVTSGENGCHDLLAGQNIDAGDVCFAVDDSNSNLIVTYKTDGGWELTEAQLWVGEDQDGYPMAKKGNPKIGNFPYNAGDITGSTLYEFNVPLGSVQTAFNLSELASYCGESTYIYAMAHASVQLINANGDVVQSETGWSDGEGAVQKGSWATRTPITLSVTCEDSPPPPPPTQGQETAMMFGSIELNNANDGICDIDNNAERWGWQEGLLMEGTYVRKVWAAAGNNILENGTHVGNVTITVEAESVTVNPVLFEGFSAEDTHIYIGTEAVCSNAFGKDWNSNAVTNIDTSNGIYVGVHFSVLAECGINADSPDNFCE